MGYIILLVVVTALAGACLPVQVGVNGALNRWTQSPVLAAAASFVVGTIGLAIYAAVMRIPLPQWSQAAAQPWWAWSGGILGAFYVVTVIAVAPRLGAAPTIALVVAGQMAAALVLDQFGLLGFAVRPVNLPRILGAALVVAGVVLVRRF